MPTATQKDFVVKNGIIVNTSLTLGNKTITNLVDSATASTIAAGEAISLAYALKRNSPQRIFNISDVKLTGLREIMEIAEKNMFISSF